MSQSFAEIVGHDENLLALLSITDRRSSSVGNVNVQVADIGGVCVKILAIETKNPKRYSRRIAWTILGYLLLNLTNYFDIYVKIFIEDCHRFKKSFDRQSLVFNDFKPATKRTANTKQGAKNARGGKKRRTANDDNNNNDDEENEHTRFDRFWEVPLTLEKDGNLLANLTKDTCLVPAEQITLRDFHEPSQIDTTYEEQLFNNGFGDTGQPLPFDEDDPMANPNSMSVDENMNNVMDILDIPEIPDLPNSPVIQSPVVDTTQPSKDQSTHHENTAALIAELSSLPSSAVVLPKKKKAINKRRATLMVDAEKEIPSKIMRARISDAFISCINHETSRVRMTNRSKPKTNDFFTGPAIKGCVNRDLFARGSKTRPMPVDWTIIDDVFGLKDRADDESEASDVLQSEHGSQFNRTRSQRANMSFNEQSSFDTSLMPPPPITSTPKRRRFDRSSVSRATSPANLSNLGPIFTPPSPFQNPAQSPNSTGQIVPPPVEYDDDDGLNLCFNQSNAGQLSGVPSASSFQAANDQTTTSTKTMDEEIDESESDPVEHTELMATLGKDSFEYAILTKLIRLWQKDIHPVKVEHLLKKGCNRIQAAKTFSSLLVLKKKDLVQMDNAHDGKITHISAGSKMTLSV